MSQRNGVHVERRWGFIEEVAESPEIVEELRSRLSGIPFTVSRYHWVPPSGWGEVLRGDAAFQLRCVNRENARRFYPINGSGGYLATAFGYGLEALSQAMGLSSEKRFSYGAQFLFWERLLASREHLSNHLDHPTSLRLRRSGRGLEARNSILPESIGRNSSGQDKSWTLDQLLDKGRKEAHQHGVLRPGGTDCVRYGLLRAARLNPLRIPPDEVAALFRMALFNSPGDKKIEPRLNEQVIERILNTLQPHLSDNPHEWKNWFQGPKNSLISQIAKQKRALGGELEPDIVKQVFSNQGWLAYQYVADCVHTALYCFRQLLRVPLNEIENRAFERMHLKQICFGGLPSMMLAERFPQLQLILPDVLGDEDNSGAIAIMHRLLEYYAEMAVARRSADRLTKARTKGTRRKGHITIDVELPSEEQNKSREDTDKSEVLNHLAEQIRLDQRISCFCQNPDWGMLAEDNDAMRGKVIVFCRNCPGFEYKCCVPIRTLRKMMESF
ncbi:MAG: hypothetical protein ACYC3I_18925 [Gemmataceae bacterium]